MPKLVLEMDDADGVVRACITVDGKPVGLVQQLEVKLRGVGVVVSCDVVEYGEVGKKVVELLRTVPFLHVNVLRINDDDGPPWSETDRVT